MFELCLGALQAKVLSDARLMARGLAMPFLTVAVLVLVLGCQEARATLPGSPGPLVLTALVPESDLEDSPTWAGMFRIGLDGHSTLLSTEGDTYHSPAVSPDGDSIAFIRNPGDQMWIASADHVAAATQLTFASDFIGDGASGPVFSPDGTSIFFIEADGFLGDGLWGWTLRRYSLRAESSSLTVGGIESGWNPDLDISPDGRVVSYTSGPSDSSKIVFLRLADGFSWSFDSDMPVRSVSFSPDGSKLAYLGLNDGAWRVFVSRRDGSDPVLISGGSENVRSPIFSPDGTKVAYVNREEASPEIVIAPLGSGAPVVLSAPGVDATLGEWTRDGLFRASRCKCRQRSLSVRVFNPGKLVISGKGLRTRQRSVSSGGRFKISLRWTGKRRRSLARVRFYPKGGLPVTKWRAVKR